jgi:hypothetical protein
MALFFSFFDNLEVYFYSLRCNLNYQMFIFIFQGLMWILGFVYILGGLNLYNFVCDHS